MNVNLLYLVSSYTIGIGAGGVLMYCLRRPLINGTINVCNWSVNKFVDLKWAYFTESEIGTSIKQHGEFRTPRCPIVKNNINHIFYTYRDKCYVSPDIIAPLQYEIDQVYDEDEQIMDMKLYYEGKILPKSTQQIKDWNHIKVTIDSFFGPIYDFHGTVPTIKDIKSYCDVPLLNTVDKIVVVTEFLNEFVIV